MDVKAIAKSKRAHTKHHSKKPQKIHQSQKLKAQSDGTDDSGSTKKTLGKPAVDKTHKAQKVASSLPSNWDRYDEEFDSGSEDPSGETAGKMADVILPKSKGADYRHLIQEAKSEAELNAHLDVIPSFDDVLSSEFSRGIGSMLAVRGESMLSWVGGDNFVVEDKTTATNEASFLSLNLNSLAEKLAKVDLAKRIFIEPDLLPPELSGDGLTPSSNQRSKAPQKSYTSGDIKGTHEELHLVELSKKEMITDDILEEITFDSSISSDVDPTLLKKYPTSENYVSINRRHAEDSCQSKDPKSIAFTSADSTADLSKKSAIYEATYAERELDMLLDSYNEPKILESSGSRINTFVPVLWDETSASHSQIARTGPNPSKIKLATANMDDALDDLLEETSNVVNQISLSQPEKENVVINVCQSSQAGTKSKVLDDFDSWFDTIG